MLHLARRDIIASCAVAAAVVLYLLWAVDTTLPGMGGVRGTGLVILVLGFLASASAVVPGFMELLHGNKAYLAGTALLGLVALGAGIGVAWSASSTALAVLMTALVVLWLVSTVHHAMLASRAGTSASDTGDSAAHHPGHAA